MFINPALRDVVPFVDKPLILETEPELLTAIKSQADLIPIERSLTEMAQLIIKS